MRLAVGGLNFEWWLWEPQKRTAVRSESDGGGRGLAVASVQIFATAPRE